MITSKLFQAAESALDQIDETYGEDELNEALASLGVGPRAFHRFEAKFDSEIQLKSFLLGVIAERLALSINFGLIDEEDAMELINNDDEPYEEASKEDMQDILQMAYGLETDDDVSMESLVDTLVAEVLSEESEDLSEVPSQ